MQEEALADGAAELARERQRVLDGLTQADRNANAVAGRIIPMLAFGPDHPYGRPAQGLKSTVSGITRQDLAAFHAANWKPGSSALIFAGDITLAQATEVRP